MENSCRLCTAHRCVETRFRVASSPGAVHFHQGVAQPTEVGSNALLWQNLQNRYGCCGQFSVHSQCSKILLPADAWLTMTCFLGRVMKTQNVQSKLFTTAKFCESIAYSLPIKIVAHYPLVNDIKQKMVVIIVAPVSLTAKL